MRSLGLTSRLGKGQEAFTFRKTDFPAASLATFAEMRESGELCDFVIKVGDVQISAHRLVLAANIPYFRALFESNMKESLMRETTMNGVDPQALKSVIRFIYTGDLLLTEANVIDLLNISVYLQIGDVKDACLDFLSKRIDSGNAFKVRMCAQFAGNEEMVESVDRFVRENFAELSVSEEFLDLPFSTLMEIIRRDDLNVVNEEMVFESVMRWVRDSENERIDHLPELLGNVRMEILAVDYLISRVSSDELVRGYPLCKRIVDDVINLSSSKMDMSASCELSSQERYCREKHHLKCAQRMGFGMYSVSLTPSRLPIDYYDFFNKKWTSLCDFDNMELDYFVSVGDNLYFIHCSSIHVLNLQTMKCSFLRIDNPIIEAGVTLYNEKIYFFGGLYSNLRKIRCFDSQTLSFSQVGTMRKCRQCPGAASLEGTIYITGGETWSSNDILNSAESYNPNTGHSSEISPMLKRRTWHSSAALNGRVYVCGGFVTTSFRRRPTSSCEVFDPLTNRWTLIRNMNKTKMWLSSFALNKKLYVFDNGFPDDDSIEHEIYDPETDEWVREDRIDFPPHCATANLVLTNSAVKL